MVNHLLEAVSWDISLIVVALIITSANCIFFVDELKSISGCQNVSSNLLFFALVPSV